MWLLHLGDAATQVVLRVKTIGASFEPEKIRLLTPKKKNSTDRKRMSETKRSMLKRIHRIENTFCRFDTFERLHCRVDRHLCNYIALNQLAMIIVTLKKVQYHAVGKPNLIDWIPTELSGKP